MDFMKLLKSLDELLYELVSWLVFYPLTMWRTVVNPLRMMRYADTELADRPEDQYEDTLSPPLFLLITLLLSQGFSSVLPSQFDPSVTAKQLGSASNLLLARGVIFGIYPLCMAVTLLRWKAVRITRDSLRPPFFSQCYVTAPFAFLLVLGFDLLSMPGGSGGTAGLIGLIIALVWYAQAQIRWFVLDLKIGKGLAVLAFVASLFVATIIAVLITIVISLDAKSIAAAAG